MAKLPKKFFDPDEAKMMADIDIQPLSRLLYMTLRLCHGIHDSGLGIVRVNEMMNMTGIDRACITGVLLPELKRNELIYYDNSVMFLPQTPIVEGFAGKIIPEERKDGKPPTDTWRFKKSFLNHLIYIESNPKNLKSESPYGGMNTAILKAFEFLHSEVNEMLQYLMKQEDLLLYAKSTDPSNDKETTRIQMVIKEYYSSKLLILYKNRLSVSPNSNSEPVNHTQSIVPLPVEQFRTPFQTVSNPIPNSFEPHQEEMTNPFQTVSEPIPKSSEPHQDKSANPFRTVSEPFPNSLRTVSEPFPNTLSKTPKEYMVNGSMVNGSMVKNKEIPFGIPGGAGENFLPPQGDFFVGSIEGGHTPNSPAEHGYLRTETKQDDPEVSTMLESHDLDFSTYNEGNSYGQSFSEHELRDYGLVSDDPFEVGAEGEDSEFFDSDTD